MYVDMRKRSSVDCVKLGIFLFAVIVNIYKYFIFLVYKNILTTVSPCIFYIDLICTNVCTCIYEYNIT